MENNIYIFGDSHARNNFRGMKPPNALVSLRNQNSITMHRIGRDGHIINMSPECNAPNSIFILLYGEVDARCHVKRQMNAGRDMQEVTSELVDKYFETVKNRITCYKKIILCSIVPPISMEDYYKENGPITHEYGYEGTDDERVIFTKTLNQKLAAKCSSVANCVFFDYYDHYANPNGTLRKMVALTDVGCEIRHRIQENVSIDDMLIFFEQQFLFHHCRVVDYYDSHAKDGSLEGIIECYSIPWNGWMQVTGIDKSLLCLLESQRRKKHLKCQQFIEIQTDLVIFVSVQML